VCDVIKQAVTSKDRRFQRSVAVKICHILIVTCTVPFNCCGSQSAAMPGADRTQAFNVCPTHPGMARPWEASLRHSGSVVAAGRGVFVRSTIDKPRVLPIRNVRRRRPVASSNISCCCCCCCCECSVRRDREWRVEGSYSVQRRPTQKDTGKLDALSRQLSPAAVPPPLLQSSSVLFAHRRLPFDNGWLFYNTGASLS